MFKRPPVGRRRRRRLRDGAAALPQRRRSTSATPTATSCRRSPTSASLGAGARRCSRSSPGCGRAPRARRPAPARPRPAVHARAHRPADAGHRRGRLRRALVRRLDVVRPRQRGRRRCCARAGSPAAGRCAANAGRRGRARAAAPARRTASRARAVLAAAAAVLVALVAAWATWQPLRSLNASDDALAALERQRHRRRARADAQAAHDRNPLAVEPLFVLADRREARAATSSAALRALEQAVQPPARQPRAVAAAGRLRSSTSAQAARGRAAALGAALYLDPRSSDAACGLFLRRSGSREGQVTTRSHRASIAALVAGGPPLPRCLARRRSRCSRTTTCSSTRRPTTRRHDARHAQGAGRRPPARLGVLERRRARPDAPSKPRASTRADPAAYPSDAWDRYDTLVRARRRARDRRELQPHRAGAALGDAATAAARTSPRPSSPSAEEFGDVRARGRTRYAGLPATAARRATGRSGTSPTSRAGCTPQWARTRASRAGSSPRRRSTAALVDAGVDARSQRHRPRQRHDPHRRDRAQGRAARRGADARDRRRCASSARCTASTTTCSCLTGGAATRPRLPGGRPGRRFLARHPALFHATGYAHHPYELIFAADRRPRHSDWFDDRQPRPPHDAAARVYARYGQSSRQPAACRST